MRFSNLKWVRNNSLHLFKSRQRQTLIKNVHPSCPSNCTIYARRALNYTLNVRPIPFWDVNTFTTRHRCKPHLHTRTKDKLWAMPEGCLYYLSMQNLTLTFHYGCSRLDVSTIHPVCPCSGIMQVTWKVCLKPFLGDFQHCLAQGQVRFTAEVWAHTAGLKRFQSAYWQGLLNTV